MISEEKKTTNIKAKNSLHATQISSFKYVFIFFFEKKKDAKIYIFTQKPVLKLLNCWTFKVKNSLPTPQHEFVTLNNH